MLKHRAETGYATEKQHVNSATEAFDPYSCNMNRSEE